MKTLSLFLLSLSFSATAQTLMLKDYKYPVPDIAQKKMSKEILFKEMNRRLVRIKTQSVPTVRMYGPLK